MGQAASASQMARFETEWLTRPENLAALANLPGQWIDTAHRLRRIPGMSVESAFIYSSQHTWLHVLSRSTGKEII